MGFGDAQVAWVLKQLHAGVVRVALQKGQDLRVGRVVVDDDHFGVMVGLCQGAVNGLAQVGQVVVDGDDDADFEGVVKVLLQRQSVCTGGVAWFVGQVHQPVANVALDARWHELGQVVDGIVFVERCHPLQGLGTDVSGPGVKNGLTKAARPLLGNAQWCRDTPRSGVFVTLDKRLLLSLVLRVFLARLVQLDLQLGHRCLVGRGALLQLDFKARMGPLMGWHLSAVAP